VNSLIFLLLMEVMAGIIVMILIYVKCKKDKKNVKDYFKVLIEMVKVLPGKLKEIIKEDKIKGVLKIFVGIIFMIMFYWHVMYRIKEKYI